MSDIFGPIFSSATLERAAIETIKAWMPTYVQELELQLPEYQRGTVPLPRSYASRTTFEEFPGEQLPLVVVVSPGVVGDPSPEGDGRYTAWWELGIVVVAEGRSEDDSNSLVKLYGAAIRAIMLQKSSLGNIASGVEWTDESYDNVVEAEEQRTLRGVSLTFIVQIDDVVTRSRGPAEPIPPEDAPTTLPGSQWPTAELVEVEVNKEEL